MINIDTYLTLVSVRSKSDFMSEEKNSLTPLRDIIGDLLRDGTLSFNPDDARIWQVWDDVVGPAVSRNTRPSWIKNCKLRVTVSDPIWLQELKFVEQTIRDRLNKRLGRNAVEKIDFRVGPMGDVKKDT